MFFFSAAQGGPLQNIRSVKLHKLNAQRRNGPTALHSRSTLRSADFIKAKLNDDAV